MKKLIALLSLLLCLTVFASCSGAPNMGVGGNHATPNAPNGGQVGDANGKEDIFTEDDIFAPGMNPEYGDYQYDQIIENGFVNASVKPTSSFSLDRNTASYTLMRGIINGGMKVPKDSVRIEEFINYFSYNYEKPKDGNAIAVSGTLSVCPWNKQNKLFTVNLSAEEISFENRKRNNLVFLIDTSGSMFGEDRLGLIQTAFTMLTENLADDDVVSIVTYASGTRVVSEGLKGTQKTEIANKINGLQAGGSTNGSGGIQLAYDIAQKYFIQGANNRVLLATDGDFNVGISNKNQLNEFISSKRDLGIYLSVFGVGYYNTNDTTMKTLAENGNGNYGYIDSINEARKLLVNEMGGTLVTVAKDAKIQLTFNSELINSYRLIGYESKLLTDEEFNDSNTDAGEIGSSHTVTAVYELVTTEAVLGEHGMANFVTAEVRYKKPDTQEEVSIKKEFGYNEYINAPVTEDVIFIGCVTEFGLILRESEYKANASLVAVLRRLNTLESVSSLSANEFRAEFKELVEKAMLIYG